MNNSEAKDMLIENNNRLIGDGAEQARLLKPYMQTTLLINEMINLEYTLNGGYIKVHEKGNARKDRYSSLAYANYLADIIEKEEIKKRIDNDDEIICIWN